LSLRAEDYHEDVVETDCTFVGDSDLAENRMTLVAAHCELASYVEFEAFVDDRAFLCETAPEVLVSRVEGIGVILFAVFWRSEGHFKLL
jgi:hypothetical protein